MKRLSNISTLLFIAISGCTSADIDPMERQPRFKPYGESELFADGRSMRQPPEGTVPRERRPDFTFNTGRTRPLPVPENNNAGTGTTAAATGTPTTPDTTGGARTTAATGSPAAPTNLAGVLSPEVTDTDTAGDVDRIPLPVDARLLERGRGRFDIYCAVCHGLVGDGNSVVADKMSQRLPPSLHEAKIRAYRPGTLFRVITEGYGVMAPYRGELSADDRWAIVAYVRALQRSQNARITDAPPEVEKRLAAEPEKTP